MITIIFKFLIYLKLYILFDYLLGDYFKGKYYLIHSINNLIVTYLTFSDLLICYYDFLNLNKYKYNSNIIYLTYALHAYHIIFYFKKLRIDDWLHHILMCCIALPVSFICNYGPILSHCLFFLTGLPGFIDYFLLFLSRNKYIYKITEKKINTYLNLWIRCPGSIASTTIIILSANVYHKRLSFFQYFMSIISSLLVFWNGIYFMNQVVQNYNYIIIKKKFLKKKIE
tara:strand:- start:433 stop:1113 length:681 start_codon:yes stop_codon:yes gene_type:complete